MKKSLEKSLSDKIKEVNTQKLLGLHIDNRLNFAEHVNAICKKGTTYRSYIKIMSSSLKKEKIVLQRYGKANFLVRQYCMEHMFI